MATQQAQHTPGPWELDVLLDEGIGFRIRMGSSVPYRGIYEPQHMIEWDPGVRPVDDGEEPDAEHLQYLEAKANMERIVAAVNAVEGIPTEALEAGVVRELIEAASRYLAATAVEQLSVKDRQLPENVWKAVEFARQCTTATVVALLDRIETLERQLERAIDVAVNAALTMAVEDTGQMGLWALHDTAVQRAKERLEGGASDA